MNLQIIVKSLIALTLFAVLFSLVNWEEFRFTISNARFEFLLAILALWPLSIFLSSIKWNRLLQGYKINERFGNTLLLYWIGSFFNNFLPSSVGGDSYKFLVLNNFWPGRKAAIASSMILERVIGIFVILPFPLILGFFFLGTNKNFDLIYWTYFFATIMLAVFMFFIWFIIHRYGFHFFSKTKFIIIQKIGLFIQTLFSYQDRNGIILAIFISILFFIVSSFAYHLCFMAFGQNISIVQVMTFLPIISVASAAPISINGLGVQEGLSVFLFSMFGVSLEVALAVALTSRVLLIIATSTGGIAYLFVRPAKIPGDQR